MYQKFTLNEVKQSFSLETDKNMIVTYPKIKTLNFIKQFAYAYHAEKELPPQLAAMILN